MQTKGQNKGNPCIDSRFQAQTCESMQPKGQKQGQSVHRFLISGPDLAIAASAEVKTGVIPPAQGLKHCAAAGECRMGRDFGRRSRPWLREREGPAAQRREGKHRRCAPVRSPCPQADSDAGTPPSVLRVAIFAESVENDYISV